MQPRTLEPPAQVTLSRLHSPIRGRALFIGMDGAWYIGHHYQIHSSRDQGRTWQFVTAIPTPLRRWWVDKSRLACRALRHEVRAMTCLDDGTIIAGNRKGVFRAGPGERRMSPCWIDTSIKFVAPPMSIAVGPNDRVVFGEYDASFERRIVRVFVSDDRGRSFEAVRTFPAGLILHVHKIVYDASIDKYWLFAGDHDHEPGIGLFSADLRDFEWVFKGSQIYRAVEVFDFGDRFIYGMDSDDELNWIVALDKKTGSIERIQQIHGSCIYACRFGTWLVMSTTAQPSYTKLNHCTSVDLWASRDGLTWSRAFHANKDRWPPFLFQFGTLVLPRGAGPSEAVLMSGQSIQGFDGRVLVGTITEAPQDG